MKKLIEKDLKKLGDILIDQIISDDSPAKKKQYKDYRVRVVYKEYKSRLGCYDYRFNLIEVSSFGSRTRSDLLVTFIHELSHHIQFVDTGSSGHQKNFYNIHINLLKKAIDLNVLTEEDMLRNKYGNAGNRDKIFKLINGYKRQGRADISNRMDTSLLFSIPNNIKIDDTLKVKCSIEEKDKFKERGYTWNKDEKIWTKNVKDTNELYTEEKFLDESKYQCIKIREGEYFTRTLTIIIGGNLYKRKEFLKVIGFTYSPSDKCWQKTVPIELVDKEIKTVKQIREVTSIKYSFHGNA